MISSFRSSIQGAASLMVMAKSSRRRHFFFNDVWRYCHCHLIFKMTWGVIIIVINPSLVVILRFDDAKLSRHYEALGRHEIVIVVIIFIWQTLLPFLRHF